MFDAFLWLKWLSSTYDKIFKGCEGKIGDIQDFIFFRLCLHNYVCYKNETVYN